MVWLRQAAALAAAAVLLGACGGGGGSDGGGGGAGGTSYSLSTQNVSLSTSLSGTPPTQNVIVTVQGGTVFFDVQAAATGMTLSASFSPTGQSTGVVTINPGFATVPGVYAGTVTVRGCSTVTCTGPDVPGSPQVINVTYTVLALPDITATPRVLAFAGTAPTPQNVQISSTAGAIPWNVQIDSVTGIAGWIGTSPTFGTLPSVIPFNVLTAPEGDNSATLTFTVGGGNTVKVYASYPVGAPGVNFVAPYVATTNVAGDVFIRGYGFTGATAVSFGETLVTPITVDNDSQIRATHPSLPQGNYPVTINTLSTRAQLVVVDPPNFPSVVIPRTGPSPDSVVNLIYDAQRRAVYLLDRANDRVERYRHDGTTWNADTPLQFNNAIFSGNWSIALSPDGTALLKTNSGNIARIDPGAWNYVNASPSFVPLSPLFGAIFGHLAFANDGRAIGSVSTPSGVTLYRYSMLSGAFVPLTTQSDMVNRLVAASGDGSRLLLPIFSQAGSPIQVFSSNTTTLAASAASTGGAQIVSLSRDGSRAIIAKSLGIGSEATTLYDDAFAVIGTLAAPTSLRGVVIAPSGTAAYAFDGSNILKFDLNNPGGGAIAPISTTAVASPGTGLVEMTISPDGGTLFLAGNQNLVITPVP